MVDNDCNRGLHPLECPADIAVYDTSLDTLNNNQPQELPDPKDNYQSPYAGSAVDLCKYNVARLAIYDKCQTDVK